MDTRTRALRIVEALFFLAIGADFVRNADQGGLFALTAGAAVLLRGLAAGLFAVKPRDAWPASVSWGAWFALAVAGVTLVVGATYILVRGTRAVVPHAALAVLGVVLLVWAGFELVRLRRR